MTTTTKAPPSAPALVATAPGLCGLLVKLPLDEVDDEELLAVIGDTTVATMDDVARAFGREPTTVKQGWRSAGMPGKAGAWPLGAILVWRRQHESRQSPPRRKRSEALAEIDLRLAELKLSSAEREESMASGDLIGREEVLAANKAVVAVVMARLENSAGEIEPQLPVGIAHQIVAENKRNITRALTQLAQMSPSDFLREGRELLSELRKAFDEGRLQPVQNKRRRADRRKRADRSVPQGTAASGD